MLLVRGVPRAPVRRRRRCRRSAELGEDLVRQVPHVLVDVGPLGLARLVGRCDFVPEEVLRGVATGAARVDARRRPDVGSVTISMAAVAIYLHGLAGVSPRRRFDIRTGAHFTAISLFCCARPPRNRKKAHKAKAKKTTSSSCARIVSKDQPKPTNSPREVRLLENPKNGDCKNPVWPWTDGER